MDQLIWYWFLIQFTCWKLYEYIFMEKLDHIGTVMDVDDLFMYYLKIIEIIITVNDVTLLLQLKFPRIMGI